MHGLVRHFVQRVAWKQVHLEAPCSVLLLPYTRPDTRAGYDLAKRTKRWVDDDVDRILAAGASAYVLAWRPGHRDAPIANPTAIRAAE
jgi:hypothetical protein